MTDKRIALTLPWPPSVNTYYRSVLFGRSCRVLISKAGRQYRETVLASASDHFLFFEGSERLSVSVVLCAPNRRAIDLDNRMKALLDAMQHASVYADDAQIDELRITRGPIVPGGRVEVTLTAMSREDGE